MGVGKEIEKRNHIIGFREEIEKVKNTSKDDFFVWFNAGQNIDETFIRGSWDFSCHVATPIAPFVKNVQEKTILEIGHGGGRIIAAASRHFKKAIGVDIHNENEFVMDELIKRGIQNIELIKGDGKTIPLPDNSIDVIYSFIVLQHVEKINIFNSYLSEVYRSLKPGGLAILYFGRHFKFSINRKSRLLLFMDDLYEKIICPKGFSEIPAHVNVINLKVTKSYATKQVHKIGFKILKQVFSRKGVPDGASLYGSQRGFILYKK